MDYNATDGKHFLEQVDITSREFYDFYREHRLKVVDTLRDYMFFKKALGGIMKMLGKRMSTNPNGVHIKGLGYFCCVAIGQIKTTDKTGSLLNRKKSRTQYIPYFFPEEGLGDWTMDRTFETPIREFVRRSKIKYKLHFDLIQTRVDSQEIAEKMFRHNPYRPFNYTPIVNR